MFTNDIIHEFIYTKEEEDEHITAYNIILYGIDVCMLQYYNIYHITQRCCSVYIFKKNKEQRKRKKIEIWGNEIMTFQEILFECLKNFCIHYWVNGTHVRNNVIQFIRIYVFSNKSNT